MSCLRLQQPLLAHWVGVLPGPWGLQALEPVLLLVEGRQQQLKSWEGQA